MKKASFILLVSFGIQFLQAQNLIPPVGIGTTSPQAPLHVSTTSQQMSLFQNTSAVNSWISVSNTVGTMNLGIGAALPHPYIWSYTNKFFIGADGNNPTLFINGMSNGSVGIGTINPTSLFHVVSAYPGQMSLFQSTSTSNSCISVANAVGSMNLGVGATLPHPYIWSSTGGFFIGGDVSSSPTMFINGMVNGSVGIGTTAIGSNKLAVEGTIAARKVVVTSSSFADYVFNPGYTLPSLDSVFQLYQLSSSFTGYAYRR